MPRVAAMVLVAATALLYWRALGSGFHYDDYHSIVHNPAIRSLGNAGSFFTDPRLFSVSPENAMYRPLLLLSYALNYAVSGDRPGPFHAVNVLLHAANAALVLALATGLGEGRRRSLIAAGLFAATPINSEAVYYVSSRSELLMAFFFLAACCAFARWRRQGAPGWYALSLALAAGALLAKSVAAILPLALVAVHWRLQGWSGVRRGWRAHLPFLALCLAYVAGTGALVARAMLQPVRPWSTQILTQVKAAAYYAWLWAVPVDLSVEHQFFVSRSPADLAVVAAALFLVSGAALWWRAATDRSVRFGVAWAALCLAPSALVPLIVLVNEHRLYLPGVGLCLALAAALQGLEPRWGKVAGVLAALYTILLAALSAQRGGAWADELSLWDDAARRAPLMVKPHLRLADALAAAGRGAEAEAAYSRALALRPDHPAARNNLGRLYMEQGRWDEAEAQFRRLLSVSPDNVPARLNLAGVLRRRGDWQAARSEYERVLEYDGAAAEAHRHLGTMALQVDGDPGEALRHLDQVVAAGESRAVDLLARGVALRGLGRDNEAEAAYRAAAEADPALVEAWHNLGNLYLSQGRQAEARAAYQRAAALDPDGPVGRGARKQLEDTHP
ncbi:MAG: tetratricopeptide repeat protein [Gemmatimonadota bacterium]